MPSKEIIKQSLITEMDQGIIRSRDFPMMVKQGMRDYSETVHSVGLNYITQIGRSMDDIVALSECPVYSGDEGDYAARVTREIRPDSIWFERKTMAPVLVAEFERYASNQLKNRKLQEKIENLLIAYRQLGGQVPMILFVYWTYNDGTIASDIDQYIGILDRGFHLKNGQWIPGINSAVTNYLVYQAVAQGSKNNLTIKQWIRVR